MAGHARNALANADVNAGSHSASQKRALALGRNTNARGPVVKMELYGNELAHKKVSASGACGRVYLPLAWVGKKVKIIRLD